MLNPETRRRNVNKIGRRIKERRKELGITQRQLAHSIGLDYYTMVSQMELGYVTVPPSLWVRLASSLKMDIAEFVILCLKELQPEVYEAVFGDVPTSVAWTSLKEMMEARDGKA